MLDSENYEDFYEEQDYDDSDELERTNYAYDEDDYEYIDEDDEESYEY